MFQNQRAMMAMPVHAGLGRKSRRRLQRRLQAPGPQTVCDPPCTEAGAPICCPDGSCVSSVGLCDQGAMLRAAPMSMGAGVATFPTKHNNPTTYIECANECTDLFSIGSQAWEDCLAPCRVLSAPTPKAPVCSFCGGQYCCPPNQCIKNKCMLGVTVARSKRQPKGISLRAKTASTGRASKVMARAKPTRMKPTRARPTPMTPRVLRQCLGYANGQAYLRYYKGNMPYLLAVTVQDTKFAQGQTWYYVTAPVSEQAPDGFAAWVLPCGAPGQVI